MSVSDKLKEYKDMVISERELIHHEKELKSYNLIIDVAHIKLEP